MIVSLAEAANDALFGALSVLMNGGSIEILSDGGAPLAVLQLSDPAARIEDGVLEFNEIGEGVARAQGNARSARIVTADGEEIFSCDVGDLKSDACVRFNTTNIAADTPIRIDSFVLAMP